MNLSRSCFFNDSYCFYAKRGILIVIGINRSPLMKIALPFTLLFFLLFPLFLCLIRFKTSLII